MTTNAKHYDADSRNELLGDINRMERAIGDDLAKNSDDSDHLSFSLYVASTNAAGSALQFAQYVTFGVNSHGEELKHLLQSMTDYVADTTKLLSMKTQPH